MGKRHLVWGIRCRSLSSTLVLCFLCRTIRGEPSSWPHTTTRRTRGQPPGSERGTCSGKPSRELPGGAARGRAAALQPRGGARGRHNEEVSAGNGRSGAGNARSGAAAGGAAGRGPSGRCLRAVLRLAAPRPALGRALTTRKAPSGALTAPSWRSGAARGPPPAAGPRPPFPLSSPLSVAGPRGGAAGLTGGPGAPQPRGRAGSRRHTGGVPAAAGMGERGAGDGRTGSRRRGRRQRAAL